MKRPIQLLAGLVLAFVAGLQPSVAADPAGSTPVQQMTLRNGLTVIVKPDRRAPTAVHMLWVRVGSLDEVDGVSGVAHVLEHMLFKGTKKLKPNEFSQRVAALGGSENAFTWRDYTGYFQQIPAPRLGEVMALEADRFANNSWPDVEFKREMEVVKEERRLRTEDDPRSLLSEAGDAVVFLASPYRRPVIGWMNDLDAMTPDDARAFYRRWYVPANAAVVVVGDVDPKEVFRLAQKHYGAIPARVVPARKPHVEPEQAGLRRVDLKATAEQAYVELTWKIPKLTTLEPGPANDDALALTVLAAVLDGYPGARLERALTQGPDRVADSAEAGAGLTGRGPQTFTLVGVPASGKTAAQVEAALRAELTKVARDGVTDAELNRVKTRWIASEVYKLDSLFNQARELGSYWVQGMPLDAGERVMQRLRTVTAAQVQGVAARYFSEDGLTVATLHPLPPDPNRPARARAAGARH